MTEYIYGFEPCEKIPEMKMVQREEIVRCRDCRWFTPEEEYREEVECGYFETLIDPPSCGNPERCSHHYDQLTHTTVPVHVITDPDGFCAWGERKEGSE